jgi:ABC-2 type transport system ATP-binding protein
MIRIEQLRKEYDDLVAVNDLTLEIPAGEIFGLIGPNGAGKTTTIRMACGLLTPTSGKVSVNGIDIHQRPEDAQAYVGYLSDFFAVYEDLKVWEYLDYFAHAYRLRDEIIPERVNQAIGQVGLEVKKDSLIKGLSRGMKQRLGIARAVIHQPKVLLLDEPASGLDPKARIDLRNLLLDLNKQGATILISSHILTELEGFCTSIGIMEKGRMVRSGRIDSMTATDTKRRTVRISWHGPAEKLLRDSLAAVAAVSAVVVEAQEAVMQFSGEEADLAGLLAHLISAGVPIVGFHETKQTVEDIYLKVSHNEVM